jgi:hypothetical protein
MASLVQRRKNREQAINEKCLATSSSLVSTTVHTSELFTVKYPLKSWLTCTVNVSVCIILGELGKLGMLHEAILHKCIKQVRD